MIVDSTKKPVVRCAIVRKIGNLQMHRGNSLLRHTESKLAKINSLHQHFNCTCIQV